MTPWRPTPTPVFPPKPMAEAKAPPGPRIYTAEGRRLRVEAHEGEFKLIDSLGNVHRTGAREEIEHHIGEQLRQGKYRAR